MRRVATLLIVAALVLLVSNASAGTLNVAHLPNNGLGNNGGVFMDLTDQTGAGLFINRFDSYSNAAAGNPWVMDVYTRPGTYVNNHGSPDGWTLHTTINATSTGTTTLSSLDLGAAPITVPANETVGVYLFGRIGGIRYNGTNSLPPVTTWSNPELHMFSDVVRGSLFGTLLFQPRTYAGMIHYEIIPEPASLGLLAVAGVLVLRRRS